LQYQHKMQSMKIFTRKYLILILLLVISLPTWAVMFAGGSGTKDAPYLIETAEQLKGIQTTLQTKQCTWFKMIADIDMEKTSWIPFNQTSPYNKQIYFDGNGHTIQNLKCRNQNHASFAGVLNGTVCNVHFANASVQNNASHSHIGIVAGYVGLPKGSVKGIIDNVWVEGSVKNNSTSAFAGGICGYLACGSISNCLANIDVASATTGDNGTGGICGYQYDGNNLQTATTTVNTMLKNCLFTGSVKAAGTQTGGILGKSENRYGNHIIGNINAASLLRGNTNNVGFIMGRCYNGYLDKNGCVNQNMSWNATRIYYGVENARESAGTDAFDEKDTTVYEAKTRTLLNSVGWKTKNLRDGCKYYNFENYDAVSGANQVVNVLEIDMTQGCYKVDFAYDAKADSLSAFIKNRQRAGIDVIGGINANYEMQSIYLRSNNSNVSKVTIDDSDIKWWKHEGAILGYRNGEVKVRLSDREDGHKAITNYNQSRAVDIIASAPSLIENFENIGSSFVDKARFKAQGDKLAYEDKDRHQGVRHPRTAVAMTDDGDLLLITVDGRFNGKAEGMTADELTRFIDKYFHPQYALNLDGGGSTTMCVTGYGEKETNVVNYPCDNSTFNHWGQRAREAHLIIEERDDITAITPAPNELGQQNDAHFGSVFTTTTSEAAKKIGWDETIWDLSSDMPKLKTFKNTETGISTTRTTVPQTASQTVDMFGRFVDNNKTKGIYIERGKKVLR